MLDVIIIGSGPAGLQAAINLKIRNASFTIFGKKNLSESIQKAPLINNYLGIPKVTGSDLAKAFMSHLNDLKIDIVEENVISVYSLKDKFIVNTNINSYESKALILATGKPNFLAFENEDKYLGKGVSYCATCDGLFYRNKVVALYGNNEESINDVKYLLKICSKVYYISKNVVDGAININDKIKSLAGDSKLTKIILQNDELLVDGLFIIRDSLKPEMLVPGLEINNNHVNVDKYMHTNIKGLFAAGDVTGPPFQYMKSAGEGQIAAFEVIKYLNE